MGGWVGGWVVVVVWIEMLAFPFAGEFLLWLVLSYSDVEYYPLSVISPCLHVSIGGDILDPVWGPGAGKRPSGVNLAEAFFLADKMSPSRVLERFMNIYSTCCSCCSSSR